MLASFSCRGPICATAAADKQLPVISWLLIVAIVAALVFTVAVSLCCFGLWWHRDSWLKRGNAWVPLLLTAGYCWQLFPSYHYRPLLGLDWLVPPAAAAAAVPADSA